ncbi:MAG TPA: hypothetical protein VGU69_18395 [Rhizomicrobium sp.]|nr:hypothetical protein [Rhizomicrobium sp.]
MTKTITAFAAAAVLLATPAFGGDTLEPAHGTVEGYEPAVTGVLKAAFGPEVVVRAIVEPSFEPEYAVGIEKHGDEYRIFGLTASEQVWTALNDQKPVAGINANDCRLPITADLATDILGVWKGMLLRVHTQVDSEGVDGAIYFFSMMIDGQPHIGQTWSPLPSSPPGKLVSLANAMRDVCRWNRPHALDRVTAITADLKASLQDNP